MGRIRPHPEQTVQQEGWCGAQEDGEGMMLREVRNSFPGELPRQCLQMIAAVGPHEGRGRKSMKEALGSMLRGYCVRKIWLELERRGPKAGYSKNTFLFMLILNSKQLNGHFTKWLKYCFILKNILMLSQKTQKRVYEHILYGFDSPEPISIFSSGLSCIQAHFHTDTLQQMKSCAFPTFSRNIVY